jgi:hypothetical protein
MILALSVRHTECKFSAEWKRQQLPTADLRSAMITDFKELWMWYTNCQYSVPENMHKTVLHTGK